MIGCSIVTNESGLLVEGVYNEFASELIVVDLKLKKQKFKGTQIGKFN